MYEQYPTEDIAHKWMKNKYVKNKSAFVFIDNLPNIPAENDTAR